MRFRFWMLIALALMLAALAGCAFAPGGGRGGSTVTPGPIKTLRPTFTPTPVKPKATVTPGGAAAQAPAPAGQAQPATVAPTGGTDARTLTDACSAESQRPKRPA